MSCKIVNFYIVQCWFTVASLRDIARKYASHYMKLCDHSLLNEIAYESGGVHIQSTILFIYTMLAFM